jgi:peptidoglycan/LPS O-acetylase OafA/YrhL
MYYPRLFLYVLTPCRLDTLLIGVLCAWLVRNPQFENFTRRRHDWLYLIFAVLFCVMVYFVFSRAGDYISFDMYTWGYTWIALFYASFLLIVVTDKTGPFARAMRNPLLRHFAVISYGVYLIHGQISISIHDLLFQSGFIPENIFSQTLALLLKLLITWFLAMLSWKYFERPIIKWGHSFSYGDSSRLPRPTVASKPAGLQ